jgi:hypothetical protein
VEYWQKFLRLAFGAREGAREWWTEEVAIVVVMEIIARKKLNNR